MPAAPAARAKSSGSGRGCRPPGLAGGAESSRSTSRNDAPGMCPSRYSSRPRSGAPSSHRQSTNRNLTLLGVRCESVDRAVVGGDEELTAAGLTERRDVETGIEHEPPVALERSVAEQEAPDPAAAVVAEDVPAAQPPKVAAAVGEAAGHGAAAAVAVGVDGLVVAGRPAQRRTSARVEREALVNVPAVFGERT